MKKTCLICATALVGMSLTACGSQSSKSASSSSKTSSSKVVKHHKKQAKKQDSASSNSSSATNSSSQQSNQQTQTNHSNGQSTGVNNADDAVAAARAKYGDDNGSVHWGYMIDGETGQPIRNADGSYFVKGTADNGTMTGTQYSVNVFPDGTITSN